MLIGLLLLLLVAMLLLQGSLESSRTRATVRLELLANAPKQAVQELNVALSANAEVNYITSKRGYAEMRLHDPELIAEIERQGLQNPFPDTLHMHVASTAEWIATKSILKEQEWSVLFAPKVLSQVLQEGEELVHAAGNMRAVQTISAIILALATLATAIVILSVIYTRILQQKEEIHVMHLSGAFTTQIIFRFATEASVLLMTAIGSSILLTSIVLLASPEVATLIEVPGVLMTLGAELLLLLQMY